MARTVVSSGTQTATITTEHVLLDDTTHEGKVYDAMIDMANLTSGDVVEIRLYAKLLVGGTLHRVYYARYGESQDNENNFKSPIVYVPALTVMKEWKLTLKQTVGTGRAFDWTVYTD
jgi:hypothetical protein